MKPKRVWHIINKPFVYWYFEGVCQECKKEILPNQKWAVHHFHYNFPNLYFANWMELIENGIITLVHSSCHIQIHLGNSEDYKNKSSLKNLVLCDFCGCADRGAIDRNKYFKIGNNLCRKCFKLWRAGTKQLQLDLFEK